MWLDRLLRSDGSVVGPKLNPFFVSGRHPLHCPPPSAQHIYQTEEYCMSSGRLLSLSCSADRLRPLSPGPYSFSTLLRDDGVKFKFGQDATVITHFHSVIKLLDCQLLARSALCTV